jgi:hypothetical protein
MQVSRPSRRRLNRRSLTSRPHSMQRCRVSGSRLGSPRPSIGGSLSAASRRRSSCSLMLSLDFFAVVLASAECPWSSRRGRSCVSGGIATTAGGAGRPLGAGLGRSQREPAEVRFTSVFGTPCTLLSWQHAVRVDLLLEAVEKRRAGGQVGEHLRPVCRHRALWAASRARSERSSGVGPSACEHTSLRTCVLASHALTDPAIGLDHYRPAATRQA